MAEASRAADGAIDELELMLDASARHALQRGSGQEFIAWFQQVMPILAPRFVAGIEGGDASQRAALGALGRLLWNGLPLPDNRFRPRPLPKPERNAPCPCGSGRKYKHCCAHTEQFDNPFEQLSLLKYVLQQYPRTQLKDIPVAELDVEELAFIGSEWIREGRAADAAVLLEQVFADLGRLDERAQHAFDVLADCYDALNRPKKKESLIERCLEARDRTLRSAALHRRITMFADRGQRAEAWRLFGEAQRLQPDNPMLATLEVTMLLNEGDRERMRERGQFWIARLARDRDHDYTDLIAHLRAIITNPDQAGFELESADRPGLKTLRALIAAMPPLACHYDIQRDERDACLQPRLALRRIVTEWRQSSAPLASDLGAITDVDDALNRLAPGVDWLKAHPLAWQCFEVLDDLARGLAWAGIMGGEELLLAPLLERGVALLRLTLATNEAKDRALPWTFDENRAALQMVAGLALLRRKQRRPGDARELAEWLVLKLDPEDRQELRPTLIQMCLEEDDPQAVLAVCDRYPEDDLAATDFGRALALYRLGRRDEAAQALREAARARPRILPMLLAENPKAPRLDADFIKVGGADEAWLYREESLALWTECGALEWAREIVPRRKR